MQNLFDLNKTRITAVYNPSGLPMRPVSNLLTQKEFELTAVDKTGFVSFLRMSPSAWRNNQMWAAVFCEIVLPEIPLGKNPLSLRKNAKEDLKLLSSCYVRIAAPSLVWCKKTTTGGSVLIPVFATLSSKNALNTVADDATVSEALSQGKLNKSADTAGTWDINKLNLSAIKARDKNLLKSTNAKITFREIGTVTVMFLEMSLSKRQMSHVCSNEFADVRPIDLYGILRTWAQGRSDLSIDLPSTTKPLSDIVATLPAGGEPRVNQDSMLTDASSKMYWIPREVNNVQRYDSALALSLTDSDGSVSQLHGTEMKILPSQQMVLVDWVNRKWTYVNTSGNLSVVDLSRAQPTNATHVRNFLFKSVHDDTVLNFITRVCSIASVKSYGEKLNSLEIAGSVAEYLNLNEDYVGIENKNCKLYYLEVLSDMARNTKYASHKSIYWYKLFFEYAQRILKELDKDPESFYKDWSVNGMCELRAQLICFVKYAPKTDEISVEDSARRAKYTAPLIDKDWKLPDVPYMADDRGLLPHQVKATNALRDSPDNAVLAVKAGGGKTSLVVMDILKEMKTGVKGPFLVMCPSHLIAQYVLEFSYFTESRINTVAVTSYTLRRNGLEALASMITVAPVNTVVLADYNLAKGKKTVEVGYGTSATQVYKIVEFLRQFRFQYVALDESHKLKNQNASQSKAVATLISDIPKKRLATGTFLDNGPQDAVGQYALMDPTVFGTQDDFSKAYSETGTPGKITKYRVGAELEIMNRMKSNCRYIQLGRKEWASILPPQIESFDHIVKLSDNQRKVYNTILEESMEALQLAAQSNPKLAALLGLVGTPEQDRESILEELDEDNAESDMVGGLDELLRPYISRLEKFLCAPGKDVLGKTQLSGSDLVSPKISELTDIILQHVASSTPGKVLVFTNQVDSAEELYNGLPPKLKEKVLLYTAGQKESCGAEFENNPNIICMIGVSQSMDTGLNLQFCSRLVRCETVMSPGALEQGNSRIGRPNVKTEETRPNTFYDWIIVDNTIDFTKVAYLMTKRVRIAAVEEAGNPNFANLEIPELFSLTLDNIRENNTVETLAPYLAPDGMYRNYKECVKKDNDDFKKEHPEYLTADGKLKMARLSRSEDLPGSAYMRRLPYVPGLDIYGAKQLGLVRLDQYLRIEASSIDEDSDNEDSDIMQGDDTDESFAKKQAQAMFVESVVGLDVHTEWGDGKIRGGNKLRNRVSIKMADGDLKIANVLSVFVITKPQTSGKDIRNSLAKAAGTIPIDSPADVPDVEVVQPTEKELTRAKKGQSKLLEVSLNLVVSNDMIGLELNNPDSNRVAAQTLELLNFVPVPSYYYTKVKNPQVMLKLFKAVQAAGFSIPKNVNTNLASFYTAWTKMRANALTMFGLASSTQQKNFYVLNHKAPADPKSMEAYVTVENDATNGTDTVYICMPVKGFKGNKSVVSKVHVPTIRWYMSTPQLVRYFRSPADAIKFIKILIATNHVILSNNDELHSAFTKLHKLVPKATKMTVEEFFNSK